MAAAPSSNVTTLCAAFLEAKVQAARTMAINADLPARVALLELQNVTMSKALYGQRSEGGHLLIDHLELGLQEFEAGASEDEALRPARRSRHNHRGGRASTASRKPLPEHRPRERIIVPVPTSCHAADLTGCRSSAKT